MKSIFPTEYEFVPKLRARIVTDDNRVIEESWIGPMFADWVSSLSESESHRIIMKQRWLTKKQTAAFWQYLGRTDKAPRRLAIEVNADDADRIRN